MDVPLLEDALGVSLLEDALGVSLLEDALDVSLLEDAMDVPLLKDALLDTLVRSEEDSVESPIVVVDSSLIFVVGFIFSIYL
jgi:hypothetical protein